MNRNSSARNRKAFGSDLGFFGDLTSEDGQIIKRYKGRISRYEAQELEDLHGNFVSSLREIGINIPETKIDFSPAGNKFLVFIKQEEFTPGELAGEIIKRGSLGDVLFVMNGVLKDALLFLNSSLWARMGFHPTIRNYAVRDDKFYMLDTFPPFSDRATTERIMKRHAPSRAFRAVMTLFPSFLNKFSIEYYDPIEMLYGIYGTVSRMRPDLGKEVRISFLSNLDIDSEIKAKIQEKMDLQGPARQFKWRFVNFLKKFK